MGGDIYTQIYTGVSTRPSTSRPLLAAYAVRRNAYEACGAPNVPVPRRMYACMDYYSKEENLQI